MAKTVKTTTLDAATPRLDLAVQALTGASRASIRGLFDHGCVTLDGILCTTAATPAERGSVLRVAFEAERKYREAPPARPHHGFRVAFEDKHLIVVEKIAGILTVPTDRAEQDTLVHRVAHYLSKGPRLTHRAAIVHRLDRDTSGLLVFGKSPAMAQALKAQFEDRKPEREYLAIVAGHLRDDKGTFRSFLATDEDLDQFSTTRPGEGKLAVTHFQVLERVRGATVVRVHLETGRRNQIRVHFSECGHPVLGDVRYEVERARHPAWKEKRLALHARTLGFSHPVTGVAVRLIAEPPPVFAAFLRATR